MISVTTSWDDGSALDLKLAALLEKYGIKGTLYIPKEYALRGLSDGDIRRLSERHEIGAHSLTHPDLRKLSQEEQRREIAGSKAWLESVTGKEVAMFCYPSGFYTEASGALAREAGYRGARTVRLGSVAVPENPFAMATTVQVYPFPFRRKAGGGLFWRYLLQPWFQRSGELRRLGVSYAAMRSWGAAARAAFDIAQKRGAVFHLWGHSWEIEQYGMWGELEQFLSYIANRPGCIYLTNGEVIPRR